MFYDSIMELLLFELGLENTFLGMYTAELVSTILIIFFALLPIFVSLVIFFACIKAVSR